MHRMEAIKVLQDEIKKEKMLTQSLRQRIDECVIELSSIRAAEKELLKSLQTKDTAVSFTAKPYLSLLVLHFSRRMCHLAHS